MTAALSDFPPADGWTTDDLAASPDDGPRRELLDGVLLVSPGPTHMHQLMAAREDKVAVHANRLGSEVYEPAGTYTETIEVAEPGPISLPLATVLPREYR